MPKKYFEKVGEDGFRKAPIGAGPYKFVSFQPGIELVLEAFDGYWRKTPSVKRLVMRSVPDESTRAAALKRGDVDIVYFINGPIAEDVRRTPGLTLAAMRTNGVLFLEFPEQWTAGLAVGRPARTAGRQPGHRPPGHQRGRVARLLRAHRQHRAAPPGVRAADRARTPTIPSAPRRCSRRPASPTASTRGEFTPYPPYNSMGEAIANYFAAVGIRTRVRTMERAAFLSAWRDKKLQGVFVGATGSAGNASTRIEAFATSKGVNSYGVHPRGRDALPGAAPGDGPQEARGDAAPDPAHARRSRGVRADLGERLHPRRTGRAWRRPG